MALSTQSVADLAEQCIGRFDQTLEIAGLANNQWAENRRADFRLWADGVGALASQHASLDSRLESRDEELALIKTILVNLKSYLGRCLIATGEEPLREAKLDVDAAIDNLALIAVAIRRSGQRSRILRADRSFDRTTLVELEMHLTCMALLRRTSPKEEFPKYHEDDPAWWQSEIDGEPTPLQDRLIEANLLRRNRFLYAQRHSKKLAIPQTPVKETVPNQPVPDRSSPKQDGVTHRQVPNNDVREMEKYPVSALISLTRASDIDSLNLDEPKISFQATKTQITSITGATEYPKLRKPPVEKSGDRDIEPTKLQKCPCCCEALPRVAVASKNAWKKHLSGDVRPYTCISEDCPSPLVLYSTRVEWEDHMKQEHPKKWKCQLCDGVESNVFSKVDELVKHVRQKHMDSFLEEDLEAVQLWPSTFTIGLDTCPLCRSAGPLDDPTLIDHVLEHTHEFALLSLPWADLPTETFQAPTTSDFYDLGRLKPVEPVFLSSLTTSSHRDGHRSEENGLIDSNVEYTTTEEPAIQTVQSPMLIWLDGLNMPQPEEWGDPVAAFMLSKLKDSRTANSGNRRDDHFARNPYFTSDSEASTQDGHFSGNPYFASESEASTRDSQREGSQTEEDEFDETIRPDDLVTQVPDKISQPANEDSSTIKPAVNGSVGSDNSLRTEVSHEPHSSSLSASTPSGPFDIFRPATPDLVRDSKLETVITNNGALVQHITYEPNHYVHQRRLRKKQTWKRVRELGRGGSGCVWLEERLDGHDNGGTFRAVKEIFKIQPPGQHLSINYDRELEAIAKFPHSKYVHCFVQFFGWYESEHSIFIAMEYMKHGNLEGYLSRPFHEEETKQIVFQLLEGLHFMHDEGFAHRNLNPANILVAEPSPHWWVKIGDIGISKRAEEETTAFHTMVGYLAPEVMGFCSAEDVIGVRSAGKDSSSMYTVAVDIWALGVIMFRLLNNRNVFGNYGQLTQYAVGTESFPSDALLQRGVSRSCMEFLELAMARSPKDRPTSHQALNHVWFGDLHDSTLPPEALLERLSIPPDDLPRKKMSVNDEDTAPSAD